MADHNTVPGQGGSRTSNSRGDVGSINFFFFQLLEEVRVMVVRDIRYFFATHARVPAKFRFVGKDDGLVENPVLMGETDNTLSQIHVSGSFPDKERKFPEILVHHIGANINDMFLGQKMGTLVAHGLDPATGEEYDNEVGERLGGKFTVNPSIQISTLGGGPRELDQLCDTLIYGFVSPIRKRLEKRGMIWLPNTCSISQDSEQNLTNLQKIFTRTFQFSLLTEWSDDFIFDGVTFSGSTLLVSQ